jgi:hypothetical protein
MIVIKVAIPRVGLAVEWQEQYAFVLRGEHLL